MDRLVGVVAGAVTAMMFATLGVKAEPGPRLALVLVNSAYVKLSVLDSCRFSGGMMAAALRRAGFAVNEQTDLSNGRIGAALSDFSDAVTSATGAVAVVYTCGYAVSFDHRAFLLPVTANLEQPTDVLSQGLLERQIVGTFAGLPVRAGLLLFDTSVPPHADGDFALSTVAQAGRLGNWGFIGAQGTGARPSGSSVLVDAMVDRLAEPGLELQALIQKWQADFAGSPGLVSAAVAPDKPAWLIGAPPQAAPILPPVAAPGQAPALAPASPSASPASNAAAPVTLNEADKRRVQLALSRLGYYTGPVDGVYGSATIAAIRRYQQDSGNAVTGALTSRQVALLLPDGH